MFVFIFGYILKIYLALKCIKLLFFSVFLYNFNVLILKNKKIIFFPLTCLIIFNSLVLFYGWKTLVYIQPSPCQVQTQLPCKFYEATIFLQSMIRVSCTGSKSPAQSKHWIYEYLWEWLKGSFLFFYFLFPISPLFLVYFEVRVKKEECIVAQEGNDGGDGLYWISQKV